MGEWIKNRGRGGFFCYYLIDGRLSMRLVVGIDNKVATARLGAGIGYNETCDNL